MAQEVVGKHGFTLIEVMFAGGILLTAFALVFGSLVNLSLAGEATERRQRAEACVSSALEQLRGMSSEERLRFDPSVLGESARDCSLSLAYIDVSGAALPIPLAPEALPAALPNPIEIQAAAVCKTTQGHAIPVRASALFWR